MRVNVVTTIRGRCKGCYACVRNCPVKAIKVEDGQAAVMQDLCIACGYCVRVCAQNAKYIREDLPDVCDALAQGREVRAMLAPSFVVEFADELRPGQLVAALRKAGFAGVYEVAWGAERVTQEYVRLLQEGKHPDGMIATPCPAVVNLVEERYPELVPQLAPVVSPMVATGRMIKKEHPGSYTVFIGPCVAKKSEVEDPEVADAVDAALTFGELRALLADMPDVRREPDLYPDEAFDGPSPGLGRLYPISGGLLRSAAIRADMLENDIIVVGGKDDCIEFLEAFKRGRDCPQFVDMLFCNGCINGPMMTTPCPAYARRRVAVDFAKSAGSGRARPAPAITAEYPAFPEIEARRAFHRRDIPMPTPTSEDIRRILKELDKTKPEDELNCGACGYNTCREKAVAVFRGLAENKMCLPYLINQLEVHNKQLAELKAYHEDIVQSITEGVVVVDRDMVVTSFNDAGRRVSRQAPQGAVGRNVFEVLPALNTPECRRAFENAIARGEPTEIGDVTYNMGGERIVVELRVSPLRNMEGEVYGAVLRSQDVTEKRRLESQLVQAEKLAALGQLAAGVAHEINTPLTLISGYAEVLADGAALDDMGKTYLSTISEEADRIAEIVRSLLSFARPNGTESGRCRVNQAVERVLKIFGGQMQHKGISVRLDLDPGDPEASIDTGELQQVLLNLVLNAVQAMPDGGRIEVVTRARREPSRAGDAGDAAGEGAAGMGGEIVEIAVKDTGRGIAPEDLPKVFDPFFTTKEVGKGTGLGLSVSFGIVQKHSGTIRAESELGKGSTFVVSLPRYAGGE